MKILNNRLSTTTLIGAILLSGWSCSKPAGTLLFNSNWEFAITNEAVDQTGGKQVDWVTVSLPHTPKIEPKVMDGQWQGICWYKKVFSLPNGCKNKQLFLKFDGAMNVCEVWVNGTKLIKKQGGYLPVVVNFTHAAFYDKPNEILVRLDNTDNETTGPKPMRQLDFNMYGGLYRDAFLIIKNPVHISDPIEAGLTASGGVFVTYPKVSSQQATVHIKTHIQNQSDQSRNVSVVQELWDGSKMIAEIASPEIEMNAGSAHEDISTLLVRHPQLWSPKSPKLYQLKTILVANDKVADAIETRIGIREINITKEGFSINGEKMFLRGVNRHQDYPYIGYALSNEAQYRDAMKIKEAGFDYVRLSHYPHAPAFMDACDELGLVVLNAILGWQYYSTNPEFQQQILQTGRDLIRRDRNHPCVIAWELSLNESWMDEYFIDSLHSIVHSEYSGHNTYSAGWQEYGYDIYLQARQHRLEHYNPPQKPYIVSEYGDWEYYAMNAGLNQDKWQNLLQAERSSRQLLADGEVRLLQQATNIQEAHNDNFNTPAFADGYWVMFDYNRGYANDLEASGIMSIDRLPKFSYYFFQSQRSPFEKSNLYKSGPMVFIATYWNEQSPLNVRIFSNCEQVELFLNGRSLGVQKPDSNNISFNLAHPPFTFKLKAFEKGTLNAKGYIGGKQVAEHAVRTPEAATNLCLAIEESGRPLRAGGGDMVFIHARLIDHNGTVVPQNGVQVEFQVDGDAQIVNPEAIRTEAGIASALMKVNAKNKSFHISARTLGVDPVSIMVTPK